MGVLTVGRPLSWEEALPHLEYVRQHGVLQFLAHYRRYEHITKDSLFYGDEIEYGLFRLDGGRAFLSLRGAEVRKLLESREREERRAIPESGKVTWHPEYGTVRPSVRPSVRRRRRRHYDEQGREPATVGALDTPGEGQGGGCGLGGPGGTGFAQKGCPQEAPRCGPPLLGRLCVPVPRSCAAAAGRGGGRGQTTPLPSMRTAAVSPPSQRATCHVFRSCA